MLPRSWAVRAFAAIAVASGLAPIASAQSITTIFTGGNGQVAGALNYYDLNVLVPISITSFDVNFSGAAGTATSIDVFVTAVGGNWAANTTNAAAWTQVASGPGVAAGNNVPTHVDTTDFILSPGTYGVAIRYNGSGMSYTNGNGANQTYSNAQMTLTCGAAQAAPWTGALNNPRVWNGTIYYTLVGGPGACCNPNGTCTVIDLATCAAPNIPQAPNTTCSGPGGTCPGDVGRCCNNTSGACTYVSGAAACGANGTYTAGTTCSTACPVSAACCNPITGGCTLIYGGTCSGTASGTTCNPNPCSTQPSICESLENVGTGTLPGGWTSLVVTGVGADWTVVSGAAHGGTNMLFTNDVDSASEQDLTMAPVTAGGNLILDLWSSFATENIWDGWLVEFSTDGGGTWTDVGQAGWLLNGYNATLNAGSANPLQGRPAFSGAFATWTERACTIPANIGDQVTIRFRMGSDGSVASTGVNLDDICVYNIQVGTGACCSSTGGCAIANNTNCAGLFRGVGTTCGAGGTCTGDVGKCCNNTTGTCSLVAGAAACGTSGTYGGQGTSCSTACASVSTCCNNATGACNAIFGGSCTATQTAGTGSTCGTNSCLSVATCCNNTTGACAAIFGGSCAAGTTAGTGTSCGVNSCVSVSTCCNNTTGACNAIFGGSCAAGTTLGVGTTCDANSCPSVATCCDLSTGACTTIFGGACATGLTPGAGTTCGPDACQFGACCGGCGGCTVVATGTCTGTYGGNGSTCAVACPDDGYHFAPSPGGVAYIAATNDIGLYADDAVQAIALPFPVTFYNTPYNTVSASTNGNLQFASAAIAYANVCLPAATITGPTIFPFWDDLYTTGGGAAGNGSGIFTETIGTSPNQQFVVEWRTVYCCTAGVPINDFEVIFYEGQSYFDVVYATPMGDRSSATIGVQAGGVAGSANTQSICNTAGPVSGDMVRWTCSATVIGNGACCNNNGTCTVTANNACPTPSIFQTVGSTCSGTGGGCPAVVSACCNNTTGACAFISGTTCPATSTNRGAGSACSPTPCAATAVCCNTTSGACVQIFGGSCAAGTAIGTGTTCSPNPCPQAGACCANTGVCSATSSAGCVGLFQGLGVACSAGNTCPIAAGACCNTLGGCTYIAGSTCAAGSTFQGAGSVCSPTPCVGQPSICEGFDSVVAPALPSSWTTTVPVGAGAAWVTLVPTTPNTPNSAPNTVFTNDIATVSTQLLTLPAVIAGGPLTIDFWASFITEGATPNFYDGWTIEASINGGGFANIGAAAWTLNGYNAPAISINFTSPIAGQPAFSGNFPAWQEHTATIPAAAGDSVVIQINMSSDSSVASTGVNIDDFCVYNVLPPNSGGCCNNTTGVCSSTTQANCPSGSTFQGVGTGCSPNPCPQPPAGVCCRGSTCTTTITSAANCTASLIPGQTAGAFFATAASCNAVGNGASPCCYANYNKANGITVQDIFDFLNDWFAGSRYANVGGNGNPAPLAVQNIFDFLNAWFAGGC